ncbi:helicase [Shewanella sp. phage 1/44]|uniref:DNA helicase n=1 Tax=Shewanella sp. phage 1/44 TaxID=1458862 RepID=UPI0004F59461|nr:DNA helicase [Shewanella sp. phage 1/44]AHK11764.1 helicase [Shewanella sp. phage 1/44]
MYYSCSNYCYKGVVMIQLRQHQIEAIAQADALYASGLRNVCLVLPTGAGKTIVKAEYARRGRDRGEPCILFAHRDVLLGQISDALCIMKIHHSFIAAKGTVNDITTDNLQKHGNSYYSPTSTVIVASVDTFFRRDVSQIAPIIKWWMLDETHHLTLDSKWHKCVSLLPNARGLGVTATPIRGDKKGLGRGEPCKWEEREVIENGVGVGYESVPVLFTNDGVFDGIVVGTDMGTLIERGMLAPYRIFTPPKLVDTSGIKVTASGDYNTKDLARETDKQHITGDVIKHYQSIAHGKQTICFTVNIEHGNHVAAQFRAAGILAVNLSSKDSSAVRKREIDKFKRGETQVLINCDLFGEGFDVPAVECVIMLRETLSYSLFKQQFGRCLRVIDGKEFGILIDHVGNVEYHMLHQNLDYPHDDPVWSLERQPKAAKTKPDPKPSRVCPKCFAYYKPTSSAQHECPACSHIETPDEELNSLIMYQEKRGQLVEMNIDFVNNIVIQRKKVDESPESMKNRMQYGGAPQVAINSAVNNQRKRLNAQAQLRSVIQSWCEAACFNEQLNQKATANAFEVTFGINIYKAQVLSEREATELRLKISQHEGY